ncbi:hypothetical protein M406DRAFT_106447 [Cryphonectria parasitica EP155]|uniref:Uncharacterized protein n=1 Tax=Cryphonectria parasitica (strain ATCC 38755 / EP155) TaxID=660469 RepID=A0A9P5CQC6_CRYP1|nr:uncharacterized protein M406DRAFT_106447 [Cryphonectria parasitica EP155]KAF3767088.1 hypothetical protein M406DRAFT_106447 [Cryphonectria parasitica EP155]
MSINIEQLKLADQWAGLYIYPENHPSGRRTDGESDFTINTEPEADKINIHGSGRDKVGDFTFSGHIDRNTTVYFKKDYGTHWWHYTGSIDAETNMMYGKWGVGQEGGGGYFAFHLVNENDEAGDVSAEDQLENTKGAWSGFYTSAESGTSRRCNFELDGQVGGNGDLLAVKGNGTGPTGPYRLTGVVSKSGQVVFAKVYEKHTYLYRGTLTADGSMKGQWAGKGSSGTFYFERS